MFNLAGRADCDHYILRELQRARVPAVHGERVSGEVAYSITGKLGDFTFRRAWTYWVVQGAVPLVVAEELYADPVGKTDVRVNGNCTCPPPDGNQIDWFDKQGRKILPSEEKRDCKHYIEAGSTLADIARRILAECVFSDGPETIGGRGFVMQYHIDSEVGLRLFVDTLRKHHLCDA